ncbi:MULTISPECIES: hypothetical protein [Trichococcus]|uniref:Uncharacterized protein n=1 Tax=Trichococcus shcherbakoviae TaxID=2094020 RepID=A0A383TFR1_9LACT|nr:MULTISPECIES: hypothetical protein [Trichococcus]OUL07499.1 hypothetical protein B0533_13825 [Sedimentibacter sp. SX930]SYZ78975.1 Hypothetical protein TART1_1799 [Trichococcus shcherbakoviae]
MPKKTNISIAVLNLYTIILIGMFLLFQDQSRAVLFILFLMFINLAVFTVIVLSNKKEIRINFIVGKSRKKEMVDSFILNGSTQFLAVILFEIFSWIVLKNRDIAQTIHLCMIAVVLLVLKITTLSVLLRKII